MKLFTLLLLFSSFNISDTFCATPIEFPYNNQLFHYHEGKFLRLPNGITQFYFNTGSYSNSDTIKLSESSDDGVTWQAPRTVFIIFGAFDDTVHLSPQLLPDGRICIVYEKQNRLTYGKLYRSFSSDNGNTWSAPSIFGGGLGYTGKNPVLQTFSDKVFLFYSISESALVYRISADSGKTFGDQFTFPTEPSLSNKISGIAGHPTGLRVIVSTRVQNRLSLYLYKTTNMGISWLPAATVLEDSSDIMNASVISDGFNIIHILYDKTALSKLQKIPQQEIFYIQSTNAGETWSEQRRFTYYSRTDIKPTGFTAGPVPIFLFLSSRPTSPASAPSKLYSARLLSDNDNMAPPVILSISNSAPVVNLPISVKIKVDDERGVSEVNANLFINGTPAGSVILWDDGLHNDEFPNDNIWGGTIGAFPYNTTVYYSFTIKNINNNYFSFGGSSIQLPPFNPDTHILNENKLVFPLDQAGNLGDAGDDAGIRLDGQSLIFSGGFFLSGKKADTLWATAQLSTSRLSDYLPGSAGSDPNSTDFGIYVVNAGDSAFGGSWRGWKKAVEYGADFYDGNGDNMYDPVDLNSNGIWDPNEDKPDILGNETAWCIYNDSQIPALRRFTTMIPRQLEISQSVYSFKNPEYSLNNAVFVRYKLVNKSAFDYDSVYFSAACDPDIGLNYGQDYTGSDSLLNSCFAYKKAADQGGYGSNPPAVLLTMLQGPAVFIPGVSFTDVNMNGVYDEGIDIPLMNAFNRRGPVLPTDTIRGAMNLGMTSFLNYMGSHPTLGDPNDHTELRYYQLGGLTKTGNTVNVCNFAFGNGNTLPNCSQINPKYFYSGDPVASTGWLNTTPIDQRIVNTAGPFSLRKNKPVNIVVAYTAVRGSSPLNSVTITKQAVSQVSQAFNNNFPVVVGMREVEKSSAHSLLFQNFPNPVSKGTVIRFRVSQSEKVTIRIFDLLGNLVKTITDEVKAPGEYEAEFNCGNLANGIYFYEMKTSGYRAVKKFLVVR